MLAHKDLYKELHLQPSASTSEIRTAYRRAALLAHPDKGGSSEAFHSLTISFEVLSCPAARALYDKARALYKEARIDVNKPQHQQKPTRQDFFSEKWHTTRSHGGMPENPPLKKRKQPFTARTGAKSDKVNHSTASGADGTSNKSDPAHGAATCEHPSAKEVQRKTWASFEHLRKALQDLTPTQRKHELAIMTREMRNQLLLHMSTHPQPRATQERKRQNTCNPATKTGDAQSRGTDVRTLRHIHNTSYQAQLRVQHLRFYTRAVPDIDTALSYQMVLVQFRQQVEAAGADIWTDPLRFTAALSEVLESAELTHEELSLSVFIFMRADEWIGRFATITSPVMPLPSAVAAHAKLQAARTSSWEELKREWVALMLQTHNAYFHQMTKQQAESFADKARASQIQQQLKVALAAADRAIRQQQCVQAKTCRLQKQLQKRAKKNRAAAQAELKRALRKQDGIRAARHRWFCRSDLTMEEILKGPPSQLFGP